MDIVGAVLAPIDALNALVAAPLTLIADPTGFLTLDKAKYLFCTLLCYVLSLIYRMLPNKPILKVCSFLIFLLWFSSTLAENLPRYCAFCAGCELL
jgi:hypothetical protein